MFAEISTFVIMHLGLAVVALCCVGVTVAFPAILDPELTGGYFEGDMILGNERNGIIEPAARWPDKTVYFKIDDNIDDAHYNHIIRGIRNLEAVSCLRFFPATSSTKAYINVTANPGGCFSAVGYTGKVQPLNLELGPLDAGCFRVATVEHEFLHALGFYHQQSASDRDDFVTIVEDNIIPSTKGNFNKYDSSYITDFGVEYDYGSVMHYGPYAFTQNGEMTIVPKQEGVEIGQRRGLSNKDIYKLNLMYKCPNQS